MGRQQRAVRIEAAAEHNLREIDVSFGDGITAVVGVSGSGKSSLVFDTLHHEARRRFLETLLLGSPALRMRPAKVRAIHGLRPSVAVAQNVLNRNPNSTLATAVGVHPFLRVLYARFARRHCPRCGEAATIASVDSQLAELRTLVAGGPVEVIAPLVRGAEGSHQRLLGHLAGGFPAGSIEVDGDRYTGQPLDPERPHEIGVRVGVAEPAARVRTLRALLETVAALGTAQVTLRPRGSERPELTLSRAPLCPRCGARLPVARPQDFRAGSAVIGGYRLGGHTLTGLLGLDVEAAAHALAAAALPARARPTVEQVQRRLAALTALDLGYLTLDRPSPTLSRGEAQRVRLAVILASDIEDLLHVVDEPTIGLDPAQVGRLLGQLGRLRGPVVLVEHDRFAVAAADQVVELGPGAGPDGGRVVFDGTPARLWAADTPSGRWFSGRAAQAGNAANVTFGPSNETNVTFAANRVGGERLSVRAARMHNLRGFDCEIPVGALTVVTGPSGAGKTTLVREVLVGSLRAGSPVGCAEVAGQSLKPVFVDQSPIGRNPRSNPATYTGLAERIRALFAAATGLPGSAFSFNRREGACPDCDGMGAVEVKMRYLPSEWMTCERCQGRRFGADVLAARVELPADGPGTARVGLPADGPGTALTIAEVYRTTVQDAVPLLAGDARASHILRSLLDVGLGYLQLGQPSPTLSGGEAQRVKLAKQLATARSGQLVFLDEPTTGLHPANLSQLVSVLRMLVDRGCTVVVVEHNPDVVALADWVIRLGPGGGPAGGRLLHCGRPASGSPAGGVAGQASPRPRRRPRARPRGSAAIRVRGATANNLRDVSVSLPKQAITAVVGVSGSGKSSLVSDVLAAEAMRRLLESLSMYERQSVREGPQARVRSVVGLGPTVAIGPQRGLSGPRSTVGTATELSFHLGVLLSYAGARDCPRCGSAGRQRRTGPAPGDPWRCAVCAADGQPAPPADFSPATYEAACLHCHGIGTVAEPRVERLIVRPDRPICAGAMYSPGFFPESYLSKPANGGYWMLQALAQRYGFDPFRTPWRELSGPAQQAFLFGEEQVELSAEARRMAAKTVTWRGLFRIFASWDVGGLYTEHVPCPACAGGRLRPQFLDVKVAGMNRHALHHDPIVAVWRRLAGVRLPAQAPSWAGRSLAVIGRRLAFMDRVGLGYLHLDRLSSTLSAGEVQRTKLASLLGAELTGMTVLLDEPSRGLHPREVTALGEALADLRDGGNTVVLVDHDPQLVRRAEHLVVLGPGAGRDGGRVVAAGPLAEVRTVASARPLLEDARAELAAADASDTANTADAANTANTADAGSSGNVAAADTAGSAAAADTADTAGSAGNTAAADTADSAGNTAAADTADSAGNSGDAGNVADVAGPGSGRGRSFGSRRREPTGWMVVRKPTENNLSGQDVPIPLGVLAGICGVSGSGKSTLAVDILARALAPVRLTTSVAYQAVRPGAHERIDGAPPRVVHADQSRTGMRSPGGYLGVLGVLRRWYAASAEAAARDLREEDLTPRCDACKGRGSIREDMMFLPAVEHPCDACEATGYRAEVRELQVGGVSLAELERWTLDEVLERWAGHDGQIGQEGREGREGIVRPLRAAVRLGLGYLALGQHSGALSGGERQRLKLARELARPTGKPTLYILDEPTVGLHAFDVSRLVTALDGLAQQGHSVLVIDHDPVLLACCDRLLELGPGGGPDGGRLIATGTPEQLADAGTPTAPYLRAVLP